MKKLHNVEDYGLDRQMPASPDAERAILGACLLDNGAYFQTENLCVDDFHLHSHRLIYRSMAELVGEGKPIDFVTLTEQLGHRSEVESVGGVAYVTSLTDGLPRVKNIEQYVNIVKDKSSLRKLIAISSQTIENAYNQDSPAEELIAEADRKLCEIQGEGNQGPRHASEVVMEIRAEFERVRKIDPSKIAIGFSTGVAGLDKEILGYHKREMIVIAGETSGGKSTLMRNAIRANVHADIKTLVYTWEVQGGSFITNMLSPIANIPGSKLRDFRQMSDQRFVDGRKSEVEQFDAHLRGVGKWPVWIEDNERTNHIDQVCSSARAMIRRHGIESVWLDQASSMRSTGSNETERYEYISKSAASLARSENVQVGVLSQLTSDKERQSLKRPPRKGDTKWAKRLEEDAAILLFVWTDECGKDWIIIGKQRNGPLGKVPVTLDRGILWFEDGHK